MHAPKSPLCHRENCIWISIGVRELFKDYENWKKRTTYSQAALKRIICVSVVYLFVAKSTTSFSISDHVSWCSNNILPCLHYLACFLSFYRTYMHAVIVCLLTTSLESCLTTSMSRTAFSPFYYFKFDQLRSDWQQYRLHFSTEPWPLNGNTIIISILFEQPIGLSFLESRIWMFLMASFLSLFLSR